MSVSMVMGWSALCLTGVWLVVYAMIPGQVRLDDALAALAPSPTQESPAEEVHGIERVGAWLVHHVPGTLSPKTRAMLDVQGRTLSDFYLNKLILALVGLLGPAMLGVILDLPMMGALASVGGAVLGWMWPSLAISRDAEVFDHDAHEAINTYFDLVALERLANLSAVQSLEAAARVSHAPIFTAIHGALSLARYEQRAPWPDLYDLAEQLRLPQIADIADVMRLDEQGASLAGALTRRVQELRDAHLAREKMRSHEHTERMTIWMSLPVLIFALTLLAPPLLTIAGVS